MSVIPEEESALEFLSTCAARLITTWTGTIGSQETTISLLFHLGKVSGSGIDDDGEFSWSGSLATSGSMRFTKTYAQSGSSMVLTGTYDRAHNAVNGEAVGSKAGTSGPFSLSLDIPDIQMTVQQEEELLASQRKAAVSEYTRQREKVLHVALGQPGTSVVTTWTALYVYGSGRSDTMKDIGIRFDGSEMSGSGSDSQGDYTWSGTLSGEQFTLVKEYEGAHSIKHVGTYEARTHSVKGSWSIVGTRASGGFQMTESLSRRVNAQSMDEGTEGVADPKGVFAKHRSLAAEEGPIDDKSIADTVWSVVYVYASGRSDELRDCTLRIIEGSIHGGGEDHIGPFRWSGTLARDGTIVLDKDYDGQHTVHHEGTYTGSSGTIKGSWSVPNTRAVGGFQMTEKVQMRKGVNPRFTSALGSIDDAVVITVDFDYQYGSGDTEEAHGIQLRVARGKIYGKGADGLGECEWSGAISEGRNACELVKHYPGKHDISHKGTYDPKKGTITGSWDISGSGINGTFVATERIGVRKLPSSSSSDTRGTTSGAGGRSVAVPSMETASLDRAKSLPPLHTVREEVITTWKGSQFIGNSETVPTKFKLSFSPGSPHVIIAGKGNDDAGGDFTVTGTLDPSSFAVMLEKKYKTHSVSFSGSYAPEEFAIHGKWSMTVMKAKGEFELFEITEKRVG